RVVWRRGHPAAASHGHSRPADHATLTVAERACRTADWLDPTRVSRPCGGVGGNAPPSSVGELRDLLQPGAHAPFARQGCSAPSTCADSRAYRISHLARRSPWALLSDGIIGRHRTGPMPTSHFMPPAIRLMTLGVNIGAIYRLETLTALVLNDHAYES